MYSAWKNTQVAIPVNITLYYESLCPGCKEFIKEQLYPVWTELKNIMNAEFVPYGNANVSKHMNVQLHCNCFNELFSGRKTVYVVQLETADCSTCKLHSLH